MNDSSFREYDYFSWAFDIQMFTLKMTGQPIKVEEFDQISNCGKFWLVTASSAMEMCIKNFL